MYLNTKRQINSDAKELYLQLYDDSIPTWYTWILFFNFSQMYRDISSSQDKPSSKSAQGGGIKLLRILVISISLWKFQKVHSLTKDPDFKYLISQYKN